MPRAWITDMIMVQIVFYVYSKDFYQNSAHFVHFPSPNVLTLLTWGK